MAARPTMTDLIQRVRLMLHDPRGTAAVFTDDEIQDTLDLHRQESLYQPLLPVESIAPGGSVAYYRFDAPGGNWENGATFLDASYGTLAAPGTVENAYLRGTWTFGTAPLKPVTISGSCYDLNGAAADLLDEWASRVKSCVSFASGNQRFELNQKHAQIQAQAQLYRRRQAVGQGSAHRSDVS